MKGDSKPRSWTAEIFLGTALALLPVLYVLSSGPVIWLKDHGFITNDVAGVFCFPLIMACEWFPELGRAVNWYVCLWVQC